MAKEKELAKIPGFSQGVRENSAVRMIKMARPICPNSKIEFERDRDGRLVPKSKDPDKQNCQMAGGKWWEMCEEKGHDPYFSTHVWYTTKDKWVEDDEGNTVLAGVDTIRHESRRPNVVQVPATVRINSGRGVRQSIEKKGRKFLNEIGFEPVCEYRNCQKSINKKFVSRQFGRYCSAQHLRLVAADQQGILLTLTGTGVDLGEEARSRQKRDQQLREAGSLAVDTYGE